MMPIPKLISLINSLQPGLGGARKSALLSALLGGGVGAATGSSDSRMSNFLKGSLIGGGAGAGLHMGAGRGGAAAVSNLTRSVAIPTERESVLKLLAGLGGGGLVGGGIGGAGGAKMNDLLSKYSTDKQSSPIGQWNIRQLMALYTRIFGEPDTVTSLIDASQVKKASRSGDLGEGSGDERKSVRGRSALTQMLGSMGVGMGYNRLTNLKGLAGIPSNSFEKSLAMINPQARAVPGLEDDLLAAMTKLYPRTKPTGIFPAMQGPAYDPVSHKVYYPGFQPSKGVLAHELGHATQGLNRSPIKKMLALKGLSGLGGLGGFLGAIFSSDEDTARKSAILGTLGSAPLVGVEAHASYRGSRILNQMLKSQGKAPVGMLSKLRALKNPWLGVPTYLLGATAPLQAYGAMKMFGGYSAPEKPVKGLLNRLTNRK